jgi:hypothetical protein
MNLTSWFQLILPHPLKLIGFLSVLRERESAHNLYYHNSLWFPLLTVVPTLSLVNWVGPTWILSSRVFFLCTIFVLTWVALQERWENYFFVKYKRFENSLLLLKLKSWIRQDLKTTTICPCFYYILAMLLWFWP